VFSLLYCYFSCTKHVILQNISIYGCIWTYFIYNYIHLSNKKKGYKLNVFAKYLYITIITIKLTTQMFRLLSGHLHCEYNLQYEFLPNSYFPILDLTPPLLSSSLSLVFYPLFFPLYPMVFF